MKTLARAVIKAAASIAVGGEGGVTSERKTAALDEIATQLQTASAKEVAAIQTALAELIGEERAGAARKNIIKFYEEFFVLGW